MDSLPLSNSFFYFSAIIRVIMPIFVEVVDCEIVTREQTLISGVGNPVNRVLDHALVFTVKVSHSSGKDSHSLQSTQMQTCFMDNDKGVSDH